MKCPIYTSCSGAIASSCSASASLKAASGKQCAIARLPDSLRQLPAGVIPGGPTDEDAHLLEHLAHPGDRIRVVAASHRQRRRPHRGRRTPPRRSCSARGGGACRPRRRPSTSRSSATVLAGMRQKSGVDQPSTHGMVRGGRARRSHGDRDTIRVRCDPTSRSRSSSPTSPIASPLARFRAPDLRVDTKSDSTPVTDADRATEQALRDALQRLRPGQEIVGEEFGGERQAEWRWMLDPIDGTVNYANGVPVWATLIALMRADRAVCGRGLRACAGPALVGGDRPGCVHRRRGAHPRLARRRLSRTRTCRAPTCGTSRPVAASADSARCCERARVVRAFGDFWSHMLVAEGVIDVARRGVGQPLGCRRHPGDHDRGGWAFQRLRRRRAHRLRAT